MCVVILFLLNSLFSDLKRRLFSDTIHDDPTHSQDITYPGERAFAEKKRRLYDYEIFNRVPIAAPSAALRSFPARHRLSNTELLLRIFPKMKVNVLQLILQACRGDVIQAIEQILNKYKPDTINHFTSAHLTALQGHELSKDFHLRPEAFNFPRNDSFFPGFPRPAFSPISVYPKYQLPVGPYPLRAKYHGDTAGPRIQPYTVESRDCVTRVSATPLSAKSDNENDKNEAKDDSN